MDGSRFDAISRTFANDIPRRQVLKGLAGGVAAAAVGFIGRPEVDAARGGNGGRLDPCAVYCAGQPGARGAQCRQACHQCGGNTDRICINYGATGPSFSCCARGSFVDSGKGNMCCRAGPANTFVVNGSPQCCSTGFCGTDPMTGQRCCPAGTKSVCFTGTTDECRATKCGSDPTTGHERCCPAGTVTTCYTGSGSVCCDTACVTDPDSGWEACPSNPTTQAALNRCDKAAPRGVGIRSNHPRWRPQRARPG